MGINMLTIPINKNGFVGQLLILNRLVQGTVARGSDTFAITIWEQNLDKGSNLASAKYGTINTDESDKKFLDDVITHLTLKIPTLPHAELSAIRFRTINFNEFSKDCDAYEYHVSLTVANIVVHSPVSYDIEPFPMFKAKTET